MIDRQQLLNHIAYSDRWNNQKCPTWVYGLIGQFQDTPAENPPHPDIIPCGKCRFYRDYRCEKLKPLEDRRTMSDFCSRGEAR